MSATEPETYEAPLLGWCCFHCGENFPSTLEGQREAELHFGPTPAHKPACLERRLLTWRQVERRYRKLLRREHQAWERVHKAEEAQEVAEHVAAGWKTDLKADSSYDVKCRIASLRGQVLTSDLLMAELHRAAPDVFQAVHVAVCGPGEYFPPKTPTTPQPNHNPESQA